MTNPGESDPAHASSEPNTSSDDIIDAEIVHTGPVPGALPDPDYTDSGVPTFDFVRDKIENRITTAIGSQELAEASPEGQGVDEMMRKRDEAAKKRLAEIRKSMGQ
ncbi:PspA domain-containing protein [Gordonia sp. zg691]|uniref:PspA domain-containing protein n=1 Tax=Gordonia jinghuaiqii TaxID=2758710 RepID=UPI0016627CAB|nr:PspA domain-containing protein [Gordonia jinghuaiqii]MBD0860252.1 PspA domain-containing protein [Gordonia jinghuaiqii]